MVAKAANPSESIKLALCLTTAFSKVLTTLGHTMNQKAIDHLCNDITVAVNIAYKTNIEGAHVAHLTQASYSSKV